MTKPGNLPLGVAPRSLLRCSNRCLQGYLSSHHASQLAQPDRLHGRQRWIKAQCEDRARLLDRALVHHPAKAGVDRRVEFRARRHEHKLETSASTTAARLVLPVAE